MKKLRRITSLTDFLLNPNRTIEVFGMYDADNLGDEAMKTAALSSLPAGHVVPVTGSAIQLVNSAIVRRKRKDLVVGGGTLIHGGGPKGQNGWLDYVERRWQQGSRITLLGTGISFLESQIVNWNDSVARWSKLLQQATYVGVRGPLSKAIVERLGASAVIFGDAAISLFDNELAERHRTRPRDAVPRFGINIADVLGKDSQELFERTMERLVKELAADFRLRLFIVNPDDEDATFRVLKFAELNRERFEVVRNYSDARLFMRQAAECEAFVGTRLHSAGLAMVAGTPSLLIAYAAKSRDFVIPIGLEESVVELPVREDLLLAVTNDMLSRPDRYRNVRGIANISEEQHRTIARVFQ